MSRRLIRHPDIIEWAKINRVDLLALRRERNKLEKGFVAYAKDIVDFIKDLRGSKKSGDDKKDAKTLEENQSAASKAMAQYHQSQELLKRMKWKRATWDDEADFESFSQRILENDTMFSKCPAFSFLTIHVVKDPLVSNAGPVLKHKSKIEEGDLSGWLLQERDAEIIPRFELQANARRAPYVVDWICGEARILDTASPTEVLTFLSTSATRLQALQTKMEEQQQKITTDVENARVRLGVAKICYNGSNLSFWDDQKRKTDPANYVNPDELAQFLNSVLKAAFLYRLYFKGHEIRVTRPGTPYHIDRANKQLLIPSNFDDFSFLPLHKRFEVIERIFNFFRTTWWFWFGVSLVIVGDVEVL